MSDSTPRLRARGLEPFGPELKAEGPVETASPSSRTASGGYYVIADEDTVLGFRYAGVGGEVVEGSEQAANVFEQTCRSGRYDIVILTEEVANSIRGAVNRIRFEVQTPIVVEIPGAAGPLSGRADLLKLIQEAVGLRL
jgi:V/A-type H+-transporting ATPase subunit F